MLSNPITGIASAAIGAVQLVLSLIKNSGCGQTCIVATQCSDTAGQINAKIEEAYFSHPAPRPRSMQQAMLQAIHQNLDKLYNCCGNPNLGDAGRRCITERSPGGIYWVYIQALIDRIQNDPEVYEDGIPGSDVLAAAQAGLNKIPGGGGTLLIIGALALVAFLIARKA